MITYQQIENTAVLLSIVGTSFFIASVFVSKFIYEPKDDPDNIEKYEEKEDTDIEPIFDDSNYDNKYIKELELVDEYKKLDDEYLDDLKLKILDEETPLGLVKLYYDNEYKGFIWYCDRNHIPYRFLETVVRKYILEYDCHNLYIDLNDEINKSKNDVEKAKYKLRHRKKSVIYRQNSEVEQKVLDQLGIKNQYLKFKYAGKIDDYNNQGNNTSYNLINIDFSTFKQLKIKEKSS